MKLSLDARIKLNKYTPRDYQLPIVDALENKGYKRILGIMPRRCLSGDTHIIMHDGSFKLLKDIQPGDKILSWNGERFEEDRVKNAWKTEAKKTKKVRSGCYPSLISSANHRFANATGKSIRWNELHEIGEGRSLLHYAGHNSGTVDNKDLAEFWGFMLADGYVVGYQQPKFTNTNHTILKRVEKLALSLFDISVIWREKGNGYDLGLSNKTNGGGYTENPVKELFRNEGVDIPKSQRRLPKSIWEFNTSSLFRFFAGLISADGNIYCHKVGFTCNGRNVPPATDITFSCGASYDYAWDIYWLLRKIGIVSQHPFKERGSNWKIRVSKSSAVRKLLSHGPIFGKEEAQRKALDAIASYTKNTQVIKGCFRSRPKISLYDDMELYDIETEKNHNFIANGYLVHNSGKDITAFNLCIRECLRQPCVIYYIFPTYSQAKKVIWDSITNSGERILHYIPEEVIETSNSQEMKIRFKNGSLFQLVGSDNFDCFDDDTEILTEYGWKLFSDLDKTEKVATLDNGYLVYEKPLKYVEYWYDDDLYCVNNSSMNFRVTPNHRFWVQSQKGVYKFKTISDPTIRGYKIPSTSLWKGKIQETYLGYKVEHFMALLGIFLAEGSTFSNHKCYRVTISQIKPGVRKRIASLLAAMNISHTTTTTGFNIENKELYTYFSQFGLQHERFIPQDIKQLDTLYLNILFDWLVLGDGYRGKTYTGYYSTSKKLIDDVQELIIKLGYSGNISIRPQSQSHIKGRLIHSKKELYEIRIRTSKFKRLQGADGKQYIHKQPYKGMVYCVSVPSGIIKVRRHGKEMWSGNSLMGTNPRGCVFSEYALQDPRAYQYIRPILTANNGWALFITTPRGKNHLWELYNIAQNSPDWFCYKLTLDDTQHIPLAEIERERKEGLMSEDLIQQEYFCSFEMGVEGSYYAKYIDQMKQKGQVGAVPWENGFAVHTAWDIGVRDSTCIIFFQTIGQIVRIIDCYENNKEGFEHYARILQEKPYQYGKHFAPADISVREWGSGMTRIEKAKQLGVKFEIRRDKSDNLISVVPNVSVTDGIETVRSSFSKIWIDERASAPLIKALENYRQEWDPKKKVYKPIPLHNWASHFADSMRYLCLSLPKTQDSLSAEELDKRYYESLYGDRSIPHQLRNDKNNYRW